MKFTTRNRPTADLPGVSGPARVDRRSRSVLARIRSGDIAVIDQLDLDRATAQQFVDAGVIAVLNASAMISGRFPNLGPQVLASAGVVMVDNLGSEVFEAVREGDAVRIDGGHVHLAKDRVLKGRCLDAASVAGLVEDARTGLTHQLQSFTHNSTEFLRREQDVLLHGRGVPTLSCKTQDRPVVVVVPGAGFEQQLTQVRRFIAEQKPVVIGVDGAAERLQQRKITPDVVVLSASDQESDLISTRTLRLAKDVVLRVDPGAPRTVGDRYTKLGVQPRSFETTATTEDVALLLADAAGASVIVGVGMHATLNDFLDRQRAGLASTYLTRLKVGPRLVDAAAVSTVYSGRVRPRHLLGVFLAGVIAIAAAISTTPVGQQWADAVGEQTSSVIDTIQGKFS